MTKLMREGRNRALCRKTPPTLHEENPVCSITSSQHRLKELDVHTYSELLCGERLRKTEELGDSTGHTDRLVRTESDCSTLYLLHQHVSLHHSLRTQL